VGSLGEEDSASCFRTNVPYLGRAPPGGGPWGARDHSERATNRRRDEEFTLTTNKRPCPVLLTPDYSAYFTNLAIALAGLLKSRYMLLS